MKTMTFVVGCLLVVSHGACQSAPPARESEEHGATAPGSAPTAEAAGPSKPLPIAIVPAAEPARAAAMWMEPEDGTSAFLEKSVRIGLRLPRAERADALAKVAKATKLVRWPEGAVECM